MVLQDKNILSTFIHFFIYMIFKVSINSQANSMLKLLQVLPVFMATVLVYDAPE